MWLSNPIDFRKTELQNAKLQNLASDPGGLGSTDKGLTWFNTTSGTAKTWNGTAADSLTTILESVSGVGAISVGSVTSKSQAISIAASSGSVPGTMSAADYTTLHAAIDTNTASTIVKRDGSGNFAAGVITASLTGTASNATNLNSQAASYYLSRANHTSTQTASTISDLSSVVQAYRLDQFAAATSPITASDPTQSTHLATKNYVDNLAAGLDVKASVRLASTANVSVTYTATGGTSARGQITAAPNSLDSVTLVQGNRILLKDQTAGAQNGIYVVTTLGTGANGVWDRATDFDADSEVTGGAFMFIEEGTVNADTGWVLSTNNSITIGGSSGTALVFSQFSSSATVTAGNGLQKVGSVMSAVGTASRIAVSGSGIDIDAAYVGQTSITTLGTIATGTWSATTVALNKGGTGATTAAGARTALVAAGVYGPTNFGNGSLTTITVNHALNNTAPGVFVYDNTSNEQILANPVATDANNVTLSFATAPTTNAIRVCVVG